MEDGRDDLKKIQNGSYFHQGTTRGMNAKNIVKEKTINCQQKPTKLLTTAIFPDLLFSNCA